MPYPPLVGIFINYFLVAQLVRYYFSQIYCLIFLILKEWWGILMIFGYFGLATIFYFYYGIDNSVGNTTGWSQLLGETHVSDADDFEYDCDEPTSIGDMSSHSVLIDEIGVERGSLGSSASRKASTGSDYNSHLRVRLLNSEGKEEKTSQRMSN